MKPNNLLPVASCLLLLISSCNLENRVGNTKALADEMNNRKIKRVTTAQLNTIADEWGKTIVDEAETALSKVLTTSPTLAQKYCSLQSISTIDSLKERYGVEINLLTSNDLENKNFEMKEREVLGAYLYNLRNKIKPISNIQKLGDSVLIYNAPVAANSTICKTCSVNEGLVVWRVKFNKQEIILRVDAKSLLKMK